MQTYTNKEIIVVCSDIDKINRKLFEGQVRNSCIKFVQQKGKGLPNGRNHGVMCTKGEIVAFIDDDAVADKDWLKNLMETYALSSKIAAVGGRISPRRAVSLLHQKKSRRRLFGLIRKKLFRYIIYDGYDDRSTIGKICKCGFATYNFRAEAKKVEEVDHLIGCNMSFRRNFLSIVKEFDEEFYGKCNYEETDIFVRLKNMSLKVMYSPRAIVFHDWLEPRIRTYADVFSIYENMAYFLTKNRFLKPFQNKLQLLIYITLYLWPFCWSEFKMDLYKKNPESALRFLVFGWIQAIISGFRKGLKTQGVFY